MEHFSISSISALPFDFLFYLQYVRGVGNVTVSSISAFLFDFASSFYIFFSPLLYW